jgi:hypothetical protein
VDIPVYKLWISFDLWLLEFEIVLHPIQIIESRSSKDPSESIFNVINNVFSSNLCTSLGITCGYLLVFSGFWTQFLGKIGLLVRAEARGQPIIEP